MLPFVKRNFLSMVDSRILKISNAGLGYVRYAHLSKPHIRNAVNVLDGERCKIITMENEKKIVKD